MLIVFLYLFFVHTAYKRLNFNAEQNLGSFKEVKSILGRNCPKICLETNVISLANLVLVLVKLFLCYMNEFV